MPPVRYHLRLLRWAGLGAWIGVGLPVWLQIDKAAPRAFAGWLAAWLLFAAAFWITAAGRPLARGVEMGLLALQGACVVTLVLLLCDGFEGTLLVLVAMQLAGRVSRPADYPVWPSC